MHASAHPARGAGGRSGWTQTPVRRRVVANVSVSRRLPFVSHRRFIPCTVPDAEPLRRAVTHSAVRLLTLVSPVPNRALVRAELARERSEGRGQEKEAKLTRSFVGCVRRSDESSCQGVSIRNVRFVRSSVFLWA